MAYTRNLDDTIPLGSAQVSAGDDALRALAKDLKERLTSTFTDPNADPMVIKATSVPAAGGGILIIPGTGLQPHFDEDDIEYHEDFWRSDNNPNFYATVGFWLPTGFKITLLEVLGDKTVHASFDTKLWSVNFGTGIATNVVVVNRAVAGIGISASGALAEDTGSNKFFNIQVNSAGGGAVGFRVYGFRITYVPV